MNVNETVQSLVTLYGSGDGNGAPTEDQWRRIIEREPDAPFAFVNFFKLNAQADYGDPVNEPAASGEEAFQRYAAVSMPAMHEAGGEFLAVAPFVGSFLGEEQDWDLVAIGKYPNLDSFLTLYQNPAYVSAFRHRTAAVSRQSVVVLNL